MDWVLTHADFSQADFFLKEIDNFSGSILHWGFSVTLMQAKKRERNILFEREHMQWAIVLNLDVRGILCAYMTLFFWVGFLKVLVDARLAIVRYNSFLCLLCFFWVLFFHILDFVRFRYRFWRDNFSLWELLLKLNNYP